ncbi:MAG: HAD family hydrolase [Betaproteobacteria bacterium]|nr:HAD family hydrolase [Betaproteobacteria bacterium]
MVAQAAPHGAEELVFLFDVDNTLLDNDRVQDDLRAELAHRFGAAARERYWAILEALREELGYVDYLGALERYRLERLHDPRVLRLSSWLVDYPFAARLYPGALEVLRRARERARTVILSDGDAVFQPRKVERSGLWDAVHGQVLIYVHKEQMLADVERLYPARRYVMVDDKLRILAAMKAIWGPRLTTVFVRQGHYAADAAALAIYPPADASLARIGEFMHGDLARLTAG